MFLFINNVWDITESIDFVFRLNNFVSLLIHSETDTFIISLFLNMNS